MADNIKNEMDEEQRNHISNASDEFHYAFGLTMSQWAGVERALSFWFARLTRMNMGMASAVFYSGKSFSSRAEMLQAATEVTRGVPEADMTFIKEALKRAWSYSSFRNSVAHGEPAMTLVEIEGRPKLFRYVLTQGFRNNPSNDIGIEELKTASENFFSLQQLILDFHPAFRKQHQKSPEELLRQLRALPSQADSRNARSSSALASPGQEPVHRNKKAHRAARAKKKGGA